MLEPTLPGKLALQKSWASHLQGRGAKHKFSGCNHAVMYMCLHSLTCMKYTGVLAGSYPTDASGSRAMPNILGEMGGEWNEPFLRNPWERGRIPSQILLEGCHWLYEVTKRFQFFPGFLKSMKSPALLQVAQLCFHMQGYWAHSLTES